MQHSSRDYVSSSLSTGRNIRVYMALVFVLVSLYHVQASMENPSNRSAEDKPPNRTVDQEEMKSEETKRQMLNILGLHDLPRPRQGITPHEYMFQIYEKMSARKSDSHGVNTIRGFVDVGHADRLRRLKFHQIYSFNISALPTSEKVQSANLRLLRLSTRRQFRYAWAHGFHYRAKLHYKKTTNHLWNGRLYPHTKLIPLGTVDFDIRKPGQKWEVFDVLEALRKWQNGTNYVHNFELQIESAKTGYLMPSYDFGLSEVDRAHNQRALLVSFTDDGRVRSSEEPEKQHSSGDENDSEDSKPKGKNRVKRESRRGRKRKRQLCQRKDLIVDFASLGWSDWIIAPREYNAYFCQGFCKFPIPEHLKPTNHAMVQTTVHHVEKRQVPPACCVPHKLTGLSMLFVDKGDSVVYKKYDNMVVASCGCK